MAPYDNRNKKLYVRGRENTGLYEIQYQGGGVVPLMLRGLYTTQKAAQTAITKYESK